MDETLRQQLIRELREALAQAESPRTHTAEFEIFGHDYCIDFIDEEQEHYA